MNAFTWLFSLGLIASGKVVNFDAGPVGQVPSGWTVAMTSSGAAPRWVVLKDRNAPTPPYVLAQVSTDPSSSRFPLAIFDGVSSRDADVSVRIKPVSGREGQAGGLVWRYRDPNNYYLARANALAGDVTVYKVQNGRRTALLAGAKHPFPVNTWSILKVSARGDRFQVYVDHRRILEGRDNTFTGPGRVGLWTLADSVTYFDDFRVYPK